MEISQEQKETIIRNLLKCVDGLHMSDVEVLFDLARNRAFNTCKVSIEEYVSHTQRNAHSTFLNTRGIVGERQVMTMDNENTDTERELLREIDTLFKEMVIELIKQIKAGSRDADLIREARECYSLLIWHK